MVVAINQKKLLLIVILSAIFVSAIVYYVTEVNKNSRITIALDESLSDLKIHYETLLYHQNITAQTCYESTIEIPEFMEIFSKIRASSKQERAILRDRLEKLLEKKYARLQRRGVLQYHFVLTDNESFLRMHKPSKFGDNLTEVREDFKYVNETKTPLRGFTQGRTAHGFRNVFPIFDANGTHLGAMEISFSSDALQEYLTKVSKIHTHFLVDKEIFLAKTWARDDTVVEYTNSSEHKDYMVTINEDDNRRRHFTENVIFLNGIRGEINEKMSMKKEFSLYMRVKDNQIDVISFLPIKSLDNAKALAWIVSYKKNDFINVTLQNTLIIRVVLFVLIIILAYLVYNRIMHHSRILREITTKAYIDGLTGVYNRHKFDQISRQEFSRNQRYKRDLSIAILDIDHFRIFNNTYGHLIGDEVLIMLAQHVNDNVRESDTFARWGGEEFVILFPESDKESARVICEKLRQSIEGLEHKTAGNITVSFGVTQYIEGDTLESMFQRCDAAMYEAKEGGRNRVCVK